MSAFSSAAGGGGHEKPYNIFGWEPSLSRKSSMSSLSTESNNIVTLTPNGRVISGQVVYNLSGEQEFEENSNESEFATHTNALSAALQHTTQDIIEKEYNEDDAATELSTGFTKLGDEEGGSQTIEEIEDAIGKYKSEIDEIAKTTFDAPTPASSQDTLMTQNSESTKSELSVLSQLKQPEIIAQLIKTVLTKKKVAPEGVDLTVTKCVYQSQSVKEILTKNNRFGILKFCCANGIPISGNIGGITINDQTEKIYYSIKELEWMLEQGASTKGSTRQLRFDALMECLKEPLAMDLFDIIYNMLSASDIEAFIKICAVGGNVLRAFFLALRWARNYANGVPNMPPDDTCAAFDVWTKEQIIVLGIFADKEINNLDPLCERSSDTDLTTFRKMSKAEKAKYKRTMEIVLHILCLPPELRIAKYTELFHELPTFKLECAGPIEFPLIRMKTPIFENGEHYETTCGIIANNTETMKLANYYFPEIKWFAQMIPDDPISFLDALNEQKKYIYPALVENYPEIRKLYCTLQEVKKHNAALTSLNSDVISQGSFNYLMHFTQNCCQIFFDTISPNVKKNDNLQDIQEIVKKITPSASRAMFSILTNENTQPFIFSVLKSLNDKDYLSSSEFLEKYKTNVHILTDATGSPLPVKSSCIAVSSNVEGVSEIHKQCSAEIRHLFSEFFESKPSHVFNKNLNITLNCLRFMESTRSIDDLKETGEQPAVESFKPSIESDLPNVKSRKMKDVKPEKKKEKTVAELKSIIKKYNEGKPVKDKIKDFNNANEPMPLIRLLQNKGIMLGGAKTRKQKPRKTRKRGKRGIHKTRKGAILHNHFPK
jgi:hypothetical protein